MNTNPPRPTTIKIDQDTQERVRRLAESRPRSPHWLILEAISQYVDREEKRESFRQDGIAAWQEYQPGRVGRQLHRLPTRNETRILPNGGQAKRRLPTLQD